MKAYIVSKTTGLIENILLVDENQELGLFRNKESQEIYSEKQLVSSFNIGEQVLPEHITDLVRLDKTAEIKEAYAIYQLLPVSVIIAEGTFEFSGGYESAGKLDSKRRLVKESYDAGLISTDDVTFLDDEDGLHTMSMADALKVVIAIGNRYEEDFYKYKNLLRSIAEAIVIEEVEAISW